MKPPFKKKGSNSNRLVNKKFCFKTLFEYLMIPLLGFFQYIFKLDKQVFYLIREGWKISNPMNTVWPSETTPMISRMLAGGLWNFSFFQFHRNFYFPFWANKQYDPNDSSFIPRSHNILSINQTQRNWVSISFPGKKHEVCIDRALAIMPSYNTPTIEFAIFKSGKLIRPHDEIEKITYRLKRSDEIECFWRKMIFTIKAEEHGVRITIKGKENLIFSLRPFNMEGPALINSLKFSSEWNFLESELCIDLRKKPDLFQLSNHSLGDSLKIITKKISKRLDTKTNIHNVAKQIKSKKKLLLEIKDPRGLSNGSFFYQKAEDCELFIKDPHPSFLPKELTQDIRSNKDGSYDADMIFKEWFPTLSTAKLPGTYSELFFNVKNHLLTLWDFNTITPGSFTYHHFWVRDSAPMLHALMLIAGTKSVTKIISSFQLMLNRNGFFKSQAGEWDANGQALWVVGQYMKFSKDEKLMLQMRESIYKMLRWLEKSIKSYQGVLPPGFSAEHLGVSDWYLWDNFWAMGGVANLFPFQELFPQYDFKEIYTKILNNLSMYLKAYKYYPAALGRKKDAGMIGSISAIYPLGLADFYNKKMLTTLKILQKKHVSHGGFFQENIHSGINPYLTIQMAEALLHLGKVNEAFDMFANILKLASFVDTFPEAIHPHTKSGCMGDGFHGWAFAEIIIFIKNIFFLELPKSIVLLAGLPEAWLREDIHLKKIHTEYGCLDIEKKKDELTIQGFKNFDDKKIYLAVPSSLFKKVRPIDGVKFGNYSVNNQDIFATQLQGKKLIELISLKKNIKILL